MMPTKKQENAYKTEPAIELLDNSDLTPVHAAEHVDAWIRKKLKV